MMTWNMAVWLSVLMTLFPSPIVAQDVQSSFTG